MKNILRLRTMGSLCRQKAAQHPDQRWKLLTEAEYWYHKAQNARKLSDAAIARSYLDVQRLRDQVKKAERNCALKGSKQPGNQLSDSELRPH